MQKICYIIAGPNGAGKTTFAKEFLPQEVHCLNFINADMIAAGLAPFTPEKAAVKAAKLMIRQIDECIARGESFAFETTLSGRAYIKRIKMMKSKGYKIVIYFLALNSVNLAINRVKFRVLQGGHNVPVQDIRRRFKRSWTNFQNIYKALANDWIVLDTSGNYPVITSQSGE